MTLRFADGLPVLGYLELDDRSLTFAWNWHEPVLRVTFTEDDPPLIGHVTHLDCLPRLAAAPDNLAWLGQGDPARTRAVLDHAIDLWRRKERLFRDCEG
ncbi:hypothetical protein O1R50_21275 [Glycomyces luteolus]|uniref:Uncharacterized protein n=1 Tax=Glycomyces luteolus TaxID=2670330 RepID=A0A9X3SRX1_9ACTN|nr:hypothetical protein [Glycomyces luteolus]MDA1362172.1 hypothetical protein [Glycomyces luteolus]